MFRRLLIKVKLARPKEDIGVPDLQTLYSLPLTVLTEVVREGELKLASQFQSYASSEQRGYTLTGLTLTAATGSFAAHFSNVNAIPKNEVIQQIALYLAVGLFLSAAIGLWSVWPNSFHGPGNRPVNWLPERWIPPAKKSRSKWAHVEQAQVLQCQIEDNALSMQVRAHRQRLSLIISFIVVTVTATVAIWPVIASPI